MPGLDDYSTTLPSLYEEAKSGNTQKLREFIDDLIKYQLQELQCDATLTWHMRAGLEAPQESSRLQIFYRGITVAYRAVSSEKTPEQLKQEETSYRVR